MGGRELENDSGGLRGGQDYSIYIYSLCQGSEIRCEHMHIACKVRE